MKFDRRQLMVYAVTDRAWIGKMSLCEQVEAALKGGATMVQMREKSLTNDYGAGLSGGGSKPAGSHGAVQGPLIIDDNISWLFCAVLTASMWARMTWMPHRPERSLGRIRFWALQRKQWSRP